jgi:predicted lipoprotein with Yx(FWY)xxD motif
MPLRSVLALLVAALTAVALAASGAASPSSLPIITVRSSEYGRVLYYGPNRALYAFTRDPREKATCYRACATAWPPYIVKARLVAGTGARRSSLGTTSRKDGTPQLTYAGRPLYL